MPLTATLLSSNCFLEHSFDQMTDGLKILVVLGGKATNLMYPHSCLVHHPYSVYNKDLS